MKKNALIASTQLNADVEMKKLIRVYFDLLKVPTNLISHEHRDE